MTLPRAMAAVALVVFVVGVAGVGARATYGAATTADEPQYLLTALSIFEDGDLDIADERYSGAYREFHEATLPVQTSLRDDGSRVSPHNPLLPLILAVPMGIGGWIAAKVTMAVIAAGLAALLVWIGVERLRLPVGAVAPLVVVFSISPPLAVYATQIYPELPAALAVAGAIAALTGSPSRGTVVAWIACVVALPWLAVKYVPIAVVLALAGLRWLPAAWRRPSVVVLAVAAVGYVAFDLAVYGGLTPYASGDHFEAIGEFGAIGAAPDYLARSQRLLGLLVDRAFGLASWQPAYLLAVPAVAWVATRRDTPGAGVLLAVIATGWLVATFVAQTMHGWWWPGRQVVVILPAVVLAVAAWAHRTSREALVAGVGSVGVVSFGFLAHEATVGRIALVVDFAEVGDPIHRLWSAALPDYLTPTPRTWILHGVWIVALAAIAWWGHRERELVGLNNTVRVT